MKHHYWAERELARWSNANPPTAAWYARPLPQCTAIMALDALRQYRPSKIAFLQTIRMLLQVVRRNDPNRISERVHALA